MAVVGTYNAVQDMKSIKSNPPPQRGVIVLLIVVRIDGFHFVFSDQKVSITQ